MVAGVVSRFAYESDIERRTRSGYTVEPMPPADLRKLVEDAVFYARNIGFGPHPDYHKAMPIFGDINDRESDARFEFGKDGQPFFIAGPNEGPSRCRHILKTLEEHCGRGGFHFLIPTAQRELLHEEEPEALEGPDAQS